MSKRQDVRCYSDRFCYQLTMFEILLLARLSRLLHAHIVYEIAFAKITARICCISHCFARFDTVQCDRLLSPNNNMYDDDFIADRFRYQLTIFEMRILIWLPRLLDDHIAYEIVISKITTVDCMMWGTISMQNCIIIIIIFFFYFFYFLRPPARSLQAKNCKLDVTSEMAHSLAQKLLGCESVSERYFIYYYYYYYWSIYIATKIMLTSLDALQALGHWQYRK